MMTEFDPGGIGAKAEANSRDPVAVPRRVVERFRELKDKADQRRSLHEFFACLSACCQIMNASLVTRSSWHFQAKLETRSRSVGKFGELTRRRWTIERGVDFDEGEL